MAGFSPRAAVAALVVLAAAFAFHVAAEAVSAAGGEANAVVDCSTKTDKAAQEAEFLRGALGDAVHKELPSWLPYNVVLMVLAFMMGLGKGGVPGSSTSSVAMNSLYAPDGCLDLATALQVPVTTFADCTVVLNYIQLARWNIIFKLLPPTGIGVALGSQLVGQLSSAQAKLLIGSILSGILLLNASQEIKAHLGKAKDDNGKAEKNVDSVPAYAESLWFVWLIGLVGGFATILTNSMGPMLNVFLLTLKLDPKVFVGTRATFFTVVNCMKMAQRLASGTLSYQMMLHGSKMGLLSIVGVFVAKLIVKRMSKSLFMALEYMLMTFAASKLLYAGLTE